MNPLRDEMVSRLQTAGIATTTHMLLPYGDWGRPVWRQIHEAGQDLIRRVSSRQLTLRARESAAVIRDTYSGGPLILIGHSAGGIAASLATQLLQAEGITVSRIVQIGSPKFALSPQLEPLVAYMYAVNLKGRTTDPIVRLGSWGGWERRGGVPIWNPKRFAPANIRALPLIGGHADYFRDREPFCNVKGMTNLAITSDAIEEYLTPLINVLRRI